jgi:hypothetical protein
MASSNLTLHNLLNSLYYNMGNGKSDTLKMVQKKHNA